LGKAREYGFMNVTVKNSSEAHKAAPIFFGYGFYSKEVMDIEIIVLKDFPSWFEFLSFAFG